MIVVLVGQLTVWCIVDWLLCLSYGNASSMWLTLGQMVKHYMPVFYIEILITKLYSLEIFQIYNGIKITVKWF